MVGEEGGRQSEACIASTNLRSSPHHGSPSQFTQTLSERKQKDTCYKCGKQGHWAQDCLSGTPTKASYQEDIHQLPVLRCHCGVACTINVSGSEANPGRRYYVRNCSCDNVNVKRGKSFVKWCDEVKAPMCKCGAGACTINLQRDDRGRVTKYYTCRIRTGHGSCGFLLFDDVSPPNSWPKSMKKHKLSSIFSPQRGEPLNIMTNEDELSIPSSSNGDLVVHDAETCNFMMGKGRRVSHLISQSDIRSRQIEFWNQISAAENSPNGCEVQILGLHVHGWIGRLAFPPSQTLADPPLRHFFRCLFSEYLDISNNGGSSIIPHAVTNAEVNNVTQNSLTNGTQLLDAPLGTSSLKRSFTAMQEDVNPSLKEVRKNLQKDFFGILLSMEPTGHGAMLQASSATFDALCSVECGPFAQNMMKSVQCTSSGARMESTLQDDCSPQMQPISKNAKKCLNGISGFNAEAFAGLTASSDLLQSVHKMVSQFNDMLRQIERLETFVLDIANDVGQSKRRMKATYQELTESLKLLQDEEQCMETALSEVAVESCQRSEVRHL